jgi:protein-tyrosine phosphatase
MTTILLVGAADTGRAPMAAALLRRLLGARQYAWAVESCGVLGHDGAAAEIEARDTMVHMGLDIGDHQARSIDDELVWRAALIVAIDRGTALVVRARFPDAAAKAYSLGELAGRPRDIPDPFRMQIGAWMTYAREIESMLEAALPQIVELMPHATNDQPFDAAVPEPVEGQGRRPTANDEAGVASAAVSNERIAAAGRIAQLLQVAAQMPGVIDWAAARTRIEADLSSIAAASCDERDLVAAYAGLLRAALALLPLAPTAGQLAALQRAAARLDQSIAQADINELSAQVALLPTL